MNAPLEFDDLGAPSLAQTDVTRGPHERAAEDRASRPLPGLGDRSGLPEWVTVQEAAFLTGAAPSIIEGWSESGTVGAERLQVGRRAPVVLVRTEDLQRASGTTPTPVLSTWVAGPAPKGHRDGRGAARLLLVPAAALVVLATFSLVRHIAISPELARRVVEEDEDVADGSPSPAFPAVPTATLGSTGDGAAAGKLARARSAPIDPPGADRGGGPTLGPSQSVGGLAPVQKGSVYYVREGQSASAAVTLTNPNSRWWLPRSDLDFEALDARGRVVATYQTAVALGPGESKFVVAPTLLLGSSVHVLGSVEIVLSPVPWRPAESFVRTGVVVSGVKVRPSGGGTTVVTGRVANLGDRGVDVQVSCALWGGARLTGVGMGFLHDLPTQTSSTFAISVRFVGGKPDAANCTADPVG